MTNKVADCVGAQNDLASNRSGARDALTRRQAPVGPLTGTWDPPAPRAMADAVERVTPFSRLVPLEGLGHYTLMEGPAICRIAAAHRFVGR